MKRKKTALAMLVMTLVILTASAVLASTNTATEFQSIYNRIISWLTGLPGIIFGLVMGVLGAVRSFQTGQFVWIFGGLITAALIFVLPSIITGLGGATF